MNDEDPFSEEALRARHAVVRVDHADTDAAIQALSAIPMPDLVLIGRLKRKKLVLKDELARLDDLITPDIIA